MRATSEAGERINETTKKRGRLDCSRSFSFLVAGSVDTTRGTSFLNHHSGLVFGFAQMSPSWGPLHALLFHNAFVNHLVDR